MESILNEILLEENRLLLEQFEEIRRQVANLPRQIMEMQESSSNRRKEHVDYMWRQEPQFFYSPPPSHQPPKLDRDTELEETFIQFMEISNQKNTEASINNLEIQMGLLAEQRAYWRNEKLIANNEDGVDGEEEEQSEKIDYVQKENEKEADDEVTPEISIDHRNTGMDSCVEHVDFVFGDQLDNYAPPSSSHISSFIVNMQKKSVHIFVHNNQFICEFDVIKRVANELGWSEKKKKNKAFLLTWKGFERKLDEKQVKRPKKRKGLYYNPCLWSP